MRRFRGIVAYDGTDYSGWQSQSSRDSVQDVLEGILEGVLKAKVRVHGSGRTDSGVHANGQVFHFDGEWRHDAEKLYKALASKLPSTIRISQFKEAKADFHARFSATGKRYVYTLYLGQAHPRDVRFVWSLCGKSLDVNEMQDAARCLLGGHDFSAYGARAKGDSGSNPVKTLYRVDVKQRGRTVRITVEGSGFLYKMVRRIVGALVEVGLGRLTQGDLKRFLDLKASTKEIPTAPALGLTLDRVFFDK